MSIRHLHHPLRRILVSGFICLCSLFFTSCTRIEGGGNAYPADGVSGGTVEIRGFPGDEFIIPPDISHEVADIVFASGKKIQFKSGGKAGSVSFSTRKGRKITLTFYQITLDSDADGYPDSSELSGQEDREAVRNWMVRIAESQFIKSSPAWETGQRDCAGLVRFSLREALRKHDALWNRKTGIVVDKNIPDVRAFNYPDIPVIGGNMFKTSEAPWDDKKSFSSFADARTLIRFSMHRTGQRVEECPQGDIAVFENRMNRDWPYHMMIMCGSEGMDRILIYHTGDEQGIKRVKLSYLNSSKGFRPIEANPRFLGVYRFNLLD